MALIGPKQNKAVVDALSVIVLDRQIRFWLYKNDPMALRQAVRALNDIGELPKELQPLIYSTPGGVAAMGRLKAASWDPNTDEANEIDLNGARFGPRPAD